MQQNSFDNIPENFLQKWQEIADLLADTINVPAALIMKAENEFMEVFVTSKTKNNPYKVGDKEHWHGLYCETVIKKQKKLLIPNALKDKDWDKNPDIKLGMIAYLGLAINFPDNRPFGTLCVLDNKENKFTLENEKILKQFKNIIELDLALIQSLDLEKTDNSSIIEKLYEQNDEYTTVNEELRQTNEELLEEKQRLNEAKDELDRFFDLVPDMVCIASADGYFKRLNKMWEKVLGFPTVELETKHFTGFIHPDDIQPTYKEMEKQLNKQSVANFVNRYRSKSGEYKWLDWVAIPSPDGENLYSAARDITEKKQVENELTQAKEKLEESEENLRFLFENMVQGVIYHNPTGKIVRANQAAANILGLSLEQLYGKTPVDPRWKSIHEDGTEYSGETHPVMITIETKKPVRNSVMGIYNPPKNTYSWININSIPQFNDENELMHVVVTFEDITEMQNAKDKAEENEKKYRSLFTSMQEGVYLHELIYDQNDNPINYKIIEANPISEKFLDIDPEYAIGKKATELFKVEEAPFLDIYSKVAETTKPYMFEHYFPPMDKHFLISVFSPEKGTFATTFLDITKNKKYEQELIARKDKAEENEHILHEKNQEYEALNEELNQTNEELFDTKKRTEESEEKYRALYNNAPLSYQSLDENGNFNDINPMWLKTLGYERDEVIGKWYGDFLHPDYVRHFKANFPAFKKRGYVSNVQFKLRRKDGSYIYVAFEGCVGYTPEGKFKQTYCVFKDITEEKALENALIAAKEKAEENEKQLKRAQQTAKTGNWIWHIPENKLWWSDEMYNIFEIDKESFTGELDKVIEQAIHPEDRQAVEQSNHSVIHKNKPIPVEYRIITKTGKLKHVLGVADKIHLDKNGKSISLTGIVKDISDYKLAQIELIQAKQRAEENSRLKTAFLNNLSHEIRTPLNAICGFSTMLDNPKIDKNKRNNFVSIINRSSEQLLNIVSDVLTMSSLETNLEQLEPEAVNINAIINELLAIFKQQTVNRNISLHSKQALSDQKSVVYTDKTKFTQILSNLVSNALKFTKEGLVEFGYQITEKQNIESLLFYVKDTGIGIHPDLHHKIFDHFVQADEGIQRTFGGTGLGLSISKGFTELLGGKIWLESEVGKGSTFYFTLPYKTANEVNEPKPSIKPIKDTANATILIAEDEEFNFMYLEELLDEYDYKLIHAKDGQEALDIFKTNSDISLILMDIKMPEMDGYTAAKIIKEQKPDLPIIAQTAYALEHEVAKYEGTFDDYLVKPIKENTLIEKVNKYLNNK